MSSPSDKGPQTDQQEVLQRFNMKRIIWPILIGVLVLIYTIWKISQEDISVSDLLANTTPSNITFWLILGFGCMIMRDLGYIIRLYLLCDGKLSFRAAIEVTLLWEFVSAMSPSVVGGSPVAIWMLMKEKIAIGRGTAIIFITIFLDEIFYLLMLPTVLLSVGSDQVFKPILADGSLTGTGFFTSFWIAYTVIFLYTVFLAFAIFIRPQGTKKVFKRLFKTRLLNRWEEKGNKMAEDLETASKEFRHKGVVYWIKAGAATIMSWTGRYLVLNCVLSAFTDLNLFEHTVAFARQAIMFVLMLVSPTPGSSGIAEKAFEVLFTEFSPVGLVLALAIVWRIITYYPYVFIGIPLLPRWVARVFK
ncbi:MAG: lysylphosphatidylglycerol synthase transmembrane domain-containing protein [Bacteroidota bacterium]